ncbi:hypothetical protein [Natrinema altunense]|uniref:Uncharacterized protein n=1 Tax=Natrinema altunense (strain JCM 12890 / CGMCC 1.3731 / AJ2) TaxID=1227494 RepID=L9ZSC8_NATA2|nr:hypothetical protein [Natrinema altunense]ELY88986.1 hypothetical protein C485_05391 [Natrinema altunense JCM 12890]
MNDISRRELLATTGAGTGGIALTAGCLDRLSENGTEDTDESNATDDETATGMSTLERWVPASGSENLVFHFRDLAAIRRSADDLGAAAAEDVPRLPTGNGRGIVEEVVDDESAVTSVCRFGSEDVAGNVIATGTFDPGAVDAESESSIGEFAVLERDGVSVAVSAETVVVSPADGAALETILAAGVEGTDRRVDEHDHFAQLLERVGVDERAILWGAYEGEEAGTGRTYSWSFGADTSTYTAVAVYPDPERTADFEETMTDQFDDVTVEVDGNVGVATRTVPTAEYEYRDMFADPGSEVRAGAAIDVDQSSRTVTVTYTASGNADRIEVRADGEKRDTLTEVGQQATLEYDAGESGTVQVVAVSGDTKTQVVSNSVSF